jgi:hypothetical protein
LPLDVREKLGAALVCKSHMREFSGRKLPWQAFHLSRYLAERSLREVEADLARYQLMEGETGLFVKTPGKAEFACWAD